MIVIDKREHGLKDHIDGCKLETLVLGDICIYHEKELKILIERKTVPDLVASIKDGRYEEQGRRLSVFKDENPSVRIVYLIENCRYMLYPKEQKMYDGACLSIVMNKGFGIWYTNDIKASADMIQQVDSKLKRWEKSKTSAPPVTASTAREKKSWINPKTFLSFCVAQIPGISIEVGKAVADEWPSVVHLVESIKANRVKTLERLSLLKVNGKRLGDNRAVNISKYFRGGFKPLMKARKLVAVSK